MASKTQTAQTAAGTGWASPSLAVANGDGSALFPAGGTNYWLQLTNMTPRSFQTTDQVLGFEVEITAAGAGATSSGVDTSGFGKMMRGSGLSLSSLTLANHTQTAPQVWDGVDSTYIEDNSGSLGGCISVIHDLGSAQEVGWIEIRAGLQNGNTSFAAHYSNDGVSWSSVSFSAPLPMMSGTVYGNETVFSSAITRATARYWRLAILNVGAPRIHNFLLWSGGMYAQPGEP